LLTALATLAVGLLPSLRRRSIPGLRGHDHTGITVPDVKAATTFFTDVLGCSHAMSFGPFSDDKVAPSLKDVVNVNRARSSTRSAWFAAGYGSNIELFQYQSPDQAKTLPKNSDSGDTISRSMSTTSKRLPPISSPRTSRRCKADPGQRGSRRRTVDPVTSWRRGACSGVDQLSQRELAYEKTGQIGLWMTRYGEVNRVTGGG